MTKDKELEQLFSSAITKFDDNELFIAGLSQKLDKVEVIKRIQQEQTRRQKRYVAVAFVAGALSVVAAMALLPLLPTDMEIIRRIGDLGSVALFSHNLKVLSSIMLFALTYGLVFSIHPLATALLRKYGDIQVFA